MSSVTRFGGWLLAGMLVFSSGLAAAEDYEVVSFDYAATASADVFYQSPSNSLVVFGPAGIDGTVEVEVQVDAQGDGAIRFIQSQLVLGSLGPQTIDLGPAGSLEAQVDGIVFSLASGETVVDHGGWSLGQPGTSSSVALVGGTLTIANIQGEIATLGLERVVDYAMEPMVQLFPDPADSYSAEISGTVTPDPYGGEDISLEVEFAEFPVPLPGSGALTVRYSGSATLVPVPEPSARILVVSGLPALLLLGHRWRARHETSRR